MFHSAISLQYLLLGKLGYNLFAHLLQLPPGYHSAFLRSCIADIWSEPFYVVRQICHSGTVGR